MKLPENVAQKKINTRIEALYLQDQEPDWSTLLPFIEGDPTAPLKSDNSRQIFKIQHRDQSCHLKRYTSHRSQRWQERLNSRLPFSTPFAKKEFINATHLLNRGFNPVRPIATLSWSPTKFSHNSLIVTRTAHGQRLDKVIEEQETIEDLLPLAEKVLADLKDMYKKNISFGATQPRNIFLTPSGKLTWIDFELTKVDKTFTTGRHTDLRRFIYRFYKDSPDYIKDNPEYLPRLLSTVTNYFPLSLPFRFLMAIALPLRHKNFHFRQIFKNLKKS